MPTREALRPPPDNLHMTPAARALAIPLPIAPHINHPTQVPAAEHTHKHLDAAGDGKVTLEEFTRYYQKNDGAPARLTAIPGVAQQSSSLTNLLFQYLDANKDGKLSRAELETAANVLRKFDQDDDDLITAAEL